MNDKGSIVSVRWGDKKEHLVFSYGHVVAHLYNGKTFESQTKIKWNA